MGGGACHVGEHHGVCNGAVDSVDFSRFSVLFAAHRFGFMPPMSR